MPPVQTLQVGWYLDESNSNLEKYWDGNGWGPETRHSAEYQQLRESLISFLEYGMSFTEPTHCLNCGEPSGRRASSCGLCGADLS